jgi:hypothetical protein
VSWFLDHPVYPAVGPEYSSFTHWSSIMHRPSTIILAGIVSGCAVALHAGPVAAQSDGFIFSGDQAVSAIDKQQFISVGEKLSIPQLKQRFPSYSVSPVKSDCGGTCVAIKGKNDAYITISYGGDKTSSFYNISSDARSSRDTLGNAVGTPLRQAVGANTAKCDLGAATTCESARIKGLSYIAGGCEWNATITRVIPACAKVEGFEISRYRQR